MAQLMPVSFAKGTTVRDVVVAVRDLHVRFDIFRGIVFAVNGVDLDIRRGEILGLVGETGSGKSVTASAIVKFVRPPGRIVRGQVWFGGRDLVGLSEDALQSIRGRGISTIVQTPRAALNPLFTVGEQMRLSLATHRGLNRRMAWIRSLELLKLTGISDPLRVLRAFPHELSTGMCQRVLISMALSSEPELLIADEPTTGLDVTIQAQIVDLIRDLVRRTGTATLLITHDLGIVAEVCDRVAVMYAGRIVEEAPTVRLFERPAHPYTQGLLASTLRVDKRRPVLVIPGAVPTMLEAPSGCMFRIRCPVAKTQCAEEPPNLPIGPAHYARCLLARDEPVREPEHSRTHPA